VIREVRKHNEVTSI